MASLHHAPASRSSSSRRASRVGLPMYTAQGGGLSDDFITIGEFPPEKAEPVRPSRFVAPAEPSIDYLPPPFPPPSWREAEEPDKPFFNRHRVLIGWIFYAFFICIVSAGLLYPVLLYREREVWTQEETPAMSRRKLIFYMFEWLFISWSCFILSNLCIRVFPHVFRMVSWWVNPGLQKYWRIFRFMKSAVTWLGGSLGTYVTYTVLILNNRDLMINAKKESKPHSKFPEIEKLLTKYLHRITMRAAYRPWPRIVNDFLTVMFLWSIFFFMEKLLMLYITIHYHYRSGGNRIEHSKRLRKALVVLYDASITLNPPFHEPFRFEDEIVAASQKHSMHWFKTKSTTKIVDHALDDPRASAALAKRIWMSIVPEGRDALTVEDIVDVLKSHRRKEAEECFEALDENDNGDLTLNEMVLTVIETGRARRAIFQGMADINRAINTFDWMCCLVIGTVVTVFTLMRYVRMMKGLKNAMGITLVGLSFGFGRTLYEFLNGCIFIFLKHAYDVGDRIEVYNIAATLRTSVVVTRISILYTVFRRVDNGKELQMSNDRLNMKRVENITRSGANREEISVYVDFNTTFADIEALKAELQAFVADRANARDYQPGVEVRLSSIFEMNKLELVCSFYHKSNWANEELRAARSSKFKCALLAAVRKIPMAKPGALAVDPAAKEDFDHRREQSAYNSFTMVPLAADATTEESRLGNVASGREISSWIGQGATGLRRRPDMFGGATLY